MWIDSEDLPVGTVGYLVEQLNTNTGKRSWYMIERPLRTNQSHEPRLAGWCGETNNCSRYARGIAKIVRVNATGERAQIVRLKGQQVLAFLAADGYPELAT